MCRWGRCFILVMLFGNIKRMYGADDLDTKHVRQAGEQWYCFRDDTLTAAFSPQGLSQGVHRSLSAHEIQTFIDEHPMGLQYLYSYCGPQCVCEEENCVCDPTALFPSLYGLVEGYKLEQDGVGKKRVEVTDNGDVRVLDDATKKTSTWKLDRWSTEYDSNSSIIESPLLWDKEVQTASGGKISCQPATQVGAYRGYIEVSTRVKVPNSDKEQLKQSVLFLEKDYLNYLSEDGRWLYSPSWKWLLAYGSKQTGGRHARTSSFGYMICTEPAEFLATQGVTEKDLEIFAFLNLYIRAEKEARGMGEPNQKAMIILPTLFQRFIEDKCSVMLRHILQAGASITYRDNFVISQKMYEAMGNLETDFGKKFYPTNLGSITLCCRDTFIDSTPCVPRLTAERTPAFAITYTFLKDKRVRMGGAALLTTIGVATYYGWKWYRR